MARRKITEQTWPRMWAAYEAWEPNSPDAPTVRELLAPFDVSAQSFFAEVRRRGLPLKSRGVAPVMSQVPLTEGVNGALIDSLVDAKVRIKELERALREAGLDVPA